jgi:hypothetical protein
MTDEDARRGYVAGDRRAAVAGLREGGRDLRAAFADVEDEYRAGRLTRTGEVALLSAITEEAREIVRRMRALAPGASTFVICD